MPALCALARLGPSLRRALSPCPRSASQVPHLEPLPLRALNAAKLRTAKVVYNNANLLGASTSHEQMLMT